jgi:tetratricopeptide (TPR) repeat protein
MLNRAIQYHQTHFDVTDEGGQFVAATNLGLCYGLLGDFDVATAQHQEALRVAIRLQSFSGQSIAVGNLGLLAMRRDNLDTAKACMEQHLQLVQSLKDNAAETNAWRVLGDLLEAMGDHAGAVDAYGNSARIAEMNSELGSLKRVNCLIGVAKGNASLAEHMAALASNS